MSRNQLPALLAAALCAVAPAATAVELTDLKHVPAIHGTYAPGGDCKRTPRIEVDAGGMRFEIDGKAITSGRMEQILTYAGPDYDGISLWFFPFVEPGPNAHPILMTFNDSEIRGRLGISPYDAGYKGGPPLKARDKALVDGSPYAPCR